MSGFYVHICFWFSFFSCQSPHSVHGLLLVKKTLRKEDQSEFEEER